MSGVVAQNVGRPSGLIKAAEAGGGTWVEIKSLTASSDATLEFVDGADDVVLDSTYPVYCLRMINCHPSNNQVAWSFNVSSDTGSNYNVTKTSTVWSAHHNEIDTETSLSYRTIQDIAQGTGFQELSYTAEEGVTNQNDGSVCGQLYLFEPSSTTFIKHFLVETQLMHIGAGNYFSMHSFTSGYFNTTSVVDAIQFKFGSGDIDSGKIKLFGIKDS